MKQGIFMRRYHLFLYACLFLVPFANIYTDTTTPTPEEMAAFNQAIMNEVEKANARALDASHQVVSTPGISLSDIARLNIIANAAQVKRTLANKLLNTPAMNNADVRNAFLSIMQQDIVEQQDLIQLQALINSVNAQTAPPATQTAPKIYTNLHITPLGSNVRCV